MRESNHAFPTQNKACVCISSQLYDRRALDTTASLPLFNSLTHLTYLTSTSPRIREIMTMDGGLERLVRMLHDFCLSPPPPENPSMIYGLSPPNARPPKSSPILNPSAFDKHAAYRFSLAFQCVVNIGVRGSEAIRSRVVQAGTLDVVGCILEAWLASKGFAVGPSSSATGMPRETREQRQARRTAQQEQRQRDEAAHLQRALQRQLQMDQTQQRISRAESRRPRAIEGTNNDDDSMNVSPSPSHASLGTLDSSSRSTPNANSDTDISTDNSIATTPLGTGTPTGSVVIPSRDRSGTVIARPVWDQPHHHNGTAAMALVGNRHRPRHHEIETSPSPSTDNSRPETETEDDGEPDGDIDMDRADRSSQIDSGPASASASPSPERHHHNHARLTMARRAVGIVSDDPTNGPQAIPGALGLDTDAHIIISEPGGPTEGGVGVEVGVEDGIVSLEANDDFAMGAPPGAPGAITDAPPTHNIPLGLETGRRRNTVDAPDVTPRAGVVGLPMMAGANTTIRANHGQQHQTGVHGHHQRNITMRGRANDVGNTGGAAAIAAATASFGNLGGRTSSTSNHHHRDADSGPYRDEDVLLSLQLLAYLSKYPHVRQAFYKPRVTFHPASVNLPSARYGVGSSSSSTATSSSMPSAREKEKQRDQSSAGGKDGSGFFRTFANAASGSRGKERATITISAQSPPVVGAPAAVSTSNMRQTNVFSLVERFTFKPSSTETELPNPPPRLPPEIQYWAGVIMRNACRKDESRGGIRQCANMLCGRWETYPREFAKCRRCRKAKYCGKDCQSTAWSEGHRFWCSAKDADEDATGDHSHTHHSPHAGGESSIPISSDAGGTTSIGVQVGRGGSSRAERRERERSAREHVHSHAESDTSTVRGYRGAASSPTTASQTSAASTARAEGGLSRDRTIQPTHSRTRPRPPNPDPTNNSFLTFPLQVIGQDPPGRRRAETIMGTSSVARSTEVPPNVIPSRHPLLVIPPVDRSVDPSSARAEPGPSRRSRHLELSSTSYRSPTIEDNDMILG